MKSVNSSVFATAIRVVRNTRANSKNSQWAKIVDAKNGKILHTGQIGYIKRVARKRYNVNAEL